MPGSSGLFSALQVGLKHSDKGRIKLTPHIHAYLQDFERIPLSLATRPTRLAELIPELPSVLGACEAAKAGMGGVLFCPRFAPLLWRAPFPTSVQNRLVSFANPHGDLTNSDLEQGASRCSHRAVRPTRTHTGHSVRQHRSSESKSQRLHHSEWPTCQHVPKHQPTSASLPLLPRGLPHQRR